MFEKHLCHLFFPTSHLHWNENCVLGKMINHDHDPIVPMCDWKLCDEVHRNTYPRLLGIKKVATDLLAFGVILVLLKNKTSLDIVFYISHHMLPKVSSLQQCQCSMLSWVASPR
jgi:hypothetical protein